MKNHFLKLVLLSVLYLVMFPDALFAQSSLPGMDPRMIERIKELPPRQQRELARKYGIDIPGSSSPATEEYELGTPGTELEVIERTAKEESSIFELIDEIDALESDEEAEDELQRFGLDFFSDDLSTFTQVDNVSVPDGYVLGTGDSIAIAMVGNESLDFTVQIERDGTVLIPKIGRVSIAGMSFIQAKTMVEQRVEQQLLGTRAFLSMGRIKNINVFLMGEVKRPGSYSFSGITTLTQALYMGGGITEIGSLRSVVLKRGAEEVLRFDLYDLLLNGDRSKDVRLESGDVIFVPTMNLNASISGEVLRPAIYELIGSESANDLVVMAGGTTPQAYRKRITLKRFDVGIGQPKVISIDLTQKDESSLMLENGDEIIISELTSQISNPVQIKGAVVREGIYPWSEGTRVSDFLGSIEQDLDIEADLDVALIVRRINSRLDIDVIPFSLLEAINEAGSVKDPLINVQDQIIVLPLPNVSPGDELLELTNEDSLGIEEKTKSLEESEEEEEEVDQRVELIEPIVEKLKTQARSGEPANLVTISGAVRRAGEYPLFRAGGIRFLLALAGGLDDGAYLKNVEIRRIRMEDETNAVTEFITLDLSDEKSMDDFVLQNRDLLRINYLPDWNPDDEVEITGEVLFPGKYSISKNDTIGSLIERAGGVTESAFVEGIKYLSKSTRELQREKAQDLIRRFERERRSRVTVGLEEGSERSTDEEYGEEILKSLQGRLVIDAPRILLGDVSADIALQDGDTINVPIFVESVTVAGEVFEPGAFRYVSGRNIQDYLVLAAGLTERARRSSIYVIEPNGAVKTLPKLTARLRFFNRTSEKSGFIKPGSVIVVPTNYDYKPNLEQYRTITSVVFESVTSIAALLSISNQ